VLGTPIDVDLGADLYDATEVHHCNAIREVANHREVVGDEEVGNTQTLLKVLEQIHHARLD
jgi:hypothetical protein